MYKFTNYTAWVKWWLEKKNCDPAPKLVAFRSNVKFQPREPPIWPRFSVSNWYRYDHRWVTLWPLRTSDLRIHLCDYTLRGQTSMYISPQAWGGWRCTVPISLYLVSECYASWCVTCTNYKLEESGDWRKRALLLPLHFPLAVYVANLYRLHTSTRSLFFFSSWHFPQAV